MLVYLADRSQVISNSICHVPLIFCNTGAKTLSAVVECHIVSYLFHNIVLGFDWLRICNAHINWWACILSVKVPGGHYLLACLPCNSVASIELASLGSIFEKVDCSAVAWFTLVYLVELPDTMKAYGTFAGGESGDAKTHQWDNLFTEFAGVFEPLSIPQESEIKHRF